MQRNPDPAAANSDTERDAKHLCPSASPPVDFAEMRRLALLGADRPPIDRVPVKSLYTRELHEARTSDGWVLELTRYKPVPQPFHQPLLDEPLLLVPGWSQNRHAFSCGDFVKRLLLDGADVHILELRGHGRSSRELQRARAAQEGREPPRDLEWDWDLDSYLLEDLPAAVAAVKAKTGREKITLVGNSMGGMLGYAYAATHDDLLALCTLAAPAAIGRGYPALRLLASLGPPLIGGAVDALLGVASEADKIRHRASTLLRRVRMLERTADLLSTQLAPPAKRRFDHIPMDRWLQLLAGITTPDNLARFVRLRHLARRMGSLINPERVAHEEMLWLLQRGGEKEPRKVVEQFARWIRDGRMRCEWTGFDYLDGYAKITVPLAILYGDLDRLASRESTGEVVQRAASEYKLWRSVAENSHLELTMGQDTRLSCEAIRELVLYAKSRETGARARREVPALRAIGGGASL